MLKLSDAVTKTREAAKGKNYAWAAFQVLRSMGFKHPDTVNVGVAIIVNDIEADEKKSVLSAVTSFLGKEGAAARKAAAEQKSSQLNLVMS